MWATPLAGPSPASGTMSPNEVRQEFDSEEIDQAFEAAQPDPDGMLDAANVVDQSWPAARSGPSDDAFDPSAHPVFATETMAELLERQGDVARADEIREELGAGSTQPDVATANDHDVEWPAVPAVIEGEPEPAAAMDESDDEQVRVVATLESWLENIRRDVA